MTEPSSSFKQMALQYLDGLQLSVRVSSSVYDFPTVYLIAFWILELQTVTYLRYLNGRLNNLSLVWTKFAQQCFL